MECVYTASLPNPEELGLAVVFLVHNRKTLGFKFCPFGLQKEVRADRRGAKREALVRSVVKNRAILQCHQSCTQNLGSAHSSLLLPRSSEVAFLKPLHLS